MSLPGKRILFIIPYPVGVAPSQRFRFEQYLDILNNHGFAYEVVPFWNKEGWAVLYKHGHLIQKTRALLTGLLNRWKSLFRLGAVDFVFIHRESAPVGPPLLAWFIAKVLQKKIIYDFDDAIWLPNYAEANKLFSFFKFYSNVNAISKWAYKVSCGNHYLCEYAMKYNSNVVYNPTTIDTVSYHNQEKKYEQRPLVIGWTGSHSTTRYLNELYPVFLELEKKYSFQLYVISDQSPSFSLSSMKFIRWKKETEITDLLQFDVGIMPLKEDRWAKGKCGFKALQYMALGIPALVSPVGVNTKIVNHGINGYICENEKDWKNYLSLLIENRQQLMMLASKTRGKIIREYSVQANEANFLSLFS